MRQFGYFWIMLSLSRLVIKLVGVSLGQSLFWASLALLQRCDPFEVSNECPKYMTLHSVS